MHPLKTRNGNESTQERESFIPNKTEMSIHSFSRGFLFPTHRTQSGEEHWVSIGACVSVSQVY